MIRIAICTPIGCSDVVAALTPLADVDIEVVNSAEALGQAMAHVDVVVMTGVADAYTASIAACARESRTLRWIHLLSIGYEAFAAHGVPEGVMLTGPGGVVAASVAEHAMSLLWALARQLPVAARQQQRHVWSRQIARDIVNLEGKTLLVAGMGSVGARIATLARRFGMRVVGLSRSGATRVAVDVDELHGTNALHALLPDVDAVIAALPARADTTCLFDARAFARCRRGALFVNVGRGATVDHTALVEALTTGQLRGAALDVTEPEPLPADHPLWALENVIVTPHVGGAGDPSALRRIAANLAKNVTKFQNGMPLDNPIELADR